MTKSVTADDILKVINGQTDGLASVDRALSTQSWVLFSLLYSGWANSGGPTDSQAAYYIDRMNRVSFRGLIQRSAGPPVANEIICILPSEGRPPYVVRATVAGNTGYAQLNILPDGTVRWAQGSPLWLGLEGISFFAGSIGVSA